MDINEKERLARRHDDSLKACAARLSAALATTGMKQKLIAQEVGIGEAAISNAKSGLNYPKMPIMRWLYRGHRIDFNFLMAGEFSQLPLDVQDRLFAALKEQDVVHEPDQKTS
jgi:transcriptional regulator with XRE-family HTH domain